MLENPASVAVDALESAENRFQAGSRKVSSASWKEVGTYGAATGHRVFRFWGSGKPIGGRTSGERREAEHRVCRCGIHPLFSRCRFTPSMMSVVTSPMVNANIAVFILHPPACDVLLGVLAVAFGYRPRVRSLCRSGLLPTVALAVGSMAFVLVSIP